MYCEPFNIPQPNHVVFISSYEGGEVFRSGVTFARGLGRIFYFGPGHEEYPVYRHTDVRRVLVTAAFWAGRPERSRTAAAAFPGKQRDRVWYERETPGGSVPDRSGGHPSR
jgi:trehalose utilization protein